MLSVRFARTGNDCFESLSQNAAAENLIKVSEKRRLLRFGQIILLSYFGCFVKQIFFPKFSSIPIFGINPTVDLVMPWNEHFLPLNNKTVLSLFHGIFSQHNSVPNPTQGTAPSALVDLHLEQDQKDGVMWQRKILQIRIERRDGDSAAVIAILEIITRLKT